MNCKLIKLTTGEDLIVTTEDPCDSSLINKDHLDVTDPVVVKLMRYPKGGMVVEAYVMQPWVKLSKNNTMKIPTRNIVIAVDIEEKVELQYKLYVIQYEEYKSESSNISTEDDVDSIDYNEDELIDEFMDYLTDEGDEEDDDGPSDKRVLH